MLILLPPSEGKSAPSAGVPLDFAELSFPELTEARERIVEELSRVSQSSDAHTILKVGKTLQTEIQRNINVLEQPVAPASEIYSGVLFEALEYFNLSEEVQNRANETVFIISALWGVVRLDDKIPAYRLSMNIRLPEVGNLATFWRGELATPLGIISENQLILDCRSTAYATAWKSPPHQTFQVRVEQLHSDGKRTVVSHFAKHYRGLLARFIVEDHLDKIDSIDELLPHLKKKWDVEITAPHQNKAGVLTLIIPAPTSQ